MLVTQILSLASQATHGGNVNGCLRTVKTGLATEAPMLRSHCMARSVDQGVLSCLKIEVAASSTKWAGDTLIHKANIDCPILAIQLRSLGTRVI